MTSSFVSPPVSFHFSEFFISGLIWLQFGLSDEFSILNFKSEAIFFIKGEYQVNIGHFRSFAFEKVMGTL